MQVINNFKMTPTENCTFFIYIYPATGCAFVDLHYPFMGGKLTVSLIVKEVCWAIWPNVRQDTFPELSNEKYLEIAERIKIE